MNNQSSEPEIIASNELSEDFALIELSDRRIFLGKGPFNRAATPAQSGVSFYVNDFNLSSRRPWFIPSSYKEIKASDIAHLTNGHALPRLQWKDPNYNDFKECFDHISKLREEGVLQKAVPAVTSTSSISYPSNYCLNLVKASFPHLSSLSAYAFSVKGNGFVGLSPEQIFKLESSQVHTMALAGTSVSEENSLFENDPKEQHEHQLVVESIRRRLSGLGMVEESERKTLDIGGMVHFLSNFTVTLNEDPTIDEIIRNLHPTPALGTVPRTNETSTVLDQIRNRLKVPPMFGSPFGIKVDNFFEAFVLIRGLFFNKDTIHLPTGCGIVDGSMIGNEWDELAFKRRWVKSSFGLNQ